MVDYGLLQSLGAGLLGTYEPGGFLQGFQQDQGIQDQRKTSDLNRSIAQKRLAMDTAAQKRAEEEAALKNEAMQRANEFEKQRMAAIEQASSLLQPNPMPPLMAAGMTPQERTMSAASVLSPFDDKAMGLLMEQYAPPDPNKQYYTPIETDQGFQLFNNRTGQWSPMMGAGGKPYMKPGSNPELQRILATERASGKTEGEARTTAALDLPTYEANAENTVKMVQELRDHPGMQISVGKSSAFKPWVIPGSDAADFKARLDQVQGRQFLEAFQNLKGGGQITEIEGKKATDAISRMSTAQSEQEFRTAADEFIGIVKSGIERARNKAGMKPRVYNPATGKLE